MERAPAQNAETLITSVGYGLLGITEMQQNLSDDWWTTVITVCTAIIIWTKADLASQEPGREQHSTILIGKP